MWESFKSVCITHGSINILTTIILFYFFSSSEEKEISGPFLRATFNKRKLYPCYSKNSVVESNRQPLQKTRRHDTCKS